MEETNYHRKILPNNEVISSTIIGSPPGNAEKKIGVECRTPGIYKKKSYLDKLKLFNKTCDTRIE